MIDSAKADSVIKLISEYRRSRPITSKKIEDLLGVPGATIRDVVREARRKKIPIGSNSSGYYLITKQSELDETVKHLRSRALSELETHRLMKNIRFSEFPEQMQLFGEQA
jgi:hypothetical protein